MSLKKIISLFIMSLSIFFVACRDDFSIKNSSTKDIIKKKIAKEDIPKKISMLLITQAHCPSCKELEETMKLEKPAKLIKKYFNKKITYLGEKIPENLTPPNGTPTVYFLGYRDELLIEPMIGEKDEEGLMMFLEDALLEFKTLYNVDLTLNKEDNNETNDTKI